MAASTSQLHRKLLEHFGFRRFRPGQTEAIRSALDGRDTLVLMPTGSGKSLCFQLPALELAGTTVVVSPLIALMKDQVDQLRARGIPAQAINSTLSAGDRQAAEAAIAAGAVEFVYTTPEQLAVAEFRSLLKQTALDLFVVDEAHCISQWGHDFRPEFLMLGEAIDDLGRPAVLALTATSTEDTIADILVQLRIPNAEIIHTGFYRPNLRLEVVGAVGEQEKLTHLDRAINQQPGQGIVYAATVSAVEQIVDHLQGQDVEAAGYHGRLSAKRRAAAQDQFMAGNLKAIIATNAFGLGIDKPDIRFVIHYHLPGTIEAYYQEVGRAGRDGQPALGRLLFDPADAKLQNFFRVIDSQMKVIWSTRTTH